MHNDETSAAVTVTSARLPVNSAVLTSARERDFQNSPGSTLRLFLRFAPSRRRRGF